MYNAESMKCIITRKAFVLISLVFYIAAASAASLHAFPMIESQSNQVVTEINQGDSNHCHTENTKNENQSESSLACDVFCSVMAQVISAEPHSYPDNAARNSNMVEFRESHISLDYQVEHRPPKERS